MNYRIVEKKISVEDVCSKINGRLVGNKSLSISGVCSINEPKEGCLTLYTKSSTKKLRQLLENAKNKCPVVLVKEGNNFDLFQEDISLIYVKDPIAALSVLLKEFIEYKEIVREVHPTAQIHAGAKIGKGVHIGAYSVIEEGVEIGDNVTIYPHVVIYPFAKIGSGSIIHSGAVVREYCQLGKNSILQNGAIIGADGFGYFFDGKMLQGVPQVGITCLGDNVDIGANSCVDRATLGTTVIDFNTKLDNLVQVGHNASIGKMSILCGQVGVAGSSKIGNGVTIGGQAGVGDYAVIADKCRFAGQSAIAGEYLEPQDYAGTPAIPALEWKRQIAALVKLPQLLKTLSKKSKDSP